MAAVKLQSLVSSRMKKEVPFMNAKIEIQKLSVADVFEIQEFSKAASLMPTEKGGLDMLMLVIKKGAVDCEDITDEQFTEFPMDELTKLSNAIMEHSGMKTAEGNT